MIAPNSLIIARRYTSCTTLSPLAPRRNPIPFHHATLLLRLRLRRMNAIIRPIPSILMSPLPSRSLIDIIVSHRAPLAPVLQHALVVLLRVLGDDVPGVQEAGEKTETAECDVDEGVDAAETAFDPDCRKGKVLVCVFVCV